MVGMTALVQLLLKRQVNKNPTHNEIVDFYGFPGTLLLAEARNKRLLGTLFVNCKFNHP